MSNWLDHARRYHAAVRDVLWREWDPIGVNQYPQAGDEYDSYVPTIVQFLHRHVDRHRLIDHLWSIETVDMGLCGNRGHTESIADRLLAVRDCLEAEASHG